MHASSAVKQFWALTRKKRLIEILTSVEVDSQMSRQHSMSQDETFYANKEKCDIFLSIQYRHTQARRHTKSYTHGEGKGRKKGGRERTGANHVERKKVIRVFSKHTRRRQFRSICLFLVCECEFTRSQQILFLESGQRDSASPPIFSGSLALVGKPLRILTSYMWRIIVTSTVTLYWTHIYMYTLSALRLTHRYV